MPLLIPFIVGASATGFWWWSSSSKEEDPTFTSELFKTLQPFLILVLVVLALRWLYKQGTAKPTKK
ncbi:hypothetical protein [Aureispira anguillae]|uniref:Uncharacterized protein n=1 Tax=Aureispira anguillae TaxID=2864201 RepID=A0A915YGI3_9BACT|nr:hypothetical protein [Aureispira anguillae]BDS12734.1 hypothetical protein AsAng_0034590 [Aureispira anguillae]